MIMLAGIDAASMCMHIMGNREEVMPTCLDLVFTNEGTLSELRHLLGLGKSDHIILRFRLNCYTAILPAHDKRPNFHRANFVQLREMLSEVNWRHLSALSLWKMAIHFSENLWLECFLSVFPMLDSQSQRKICI